MAVTKAKKKKEKKVVNEGIAHIYACLLYTSPSPRD